MSQAYLRDLNQVAANVANMSKEAAYNIGSSTQVTPMHPYSNGSGMYDPDDGRAYTSRLAQKRVGYAAAQIDQGNTHMMDLLPYRQQLNEGYGAVRAGMKSASYDNEEYYADDAEYEVADWDDLTEDEQLDYVVELEESGYFDDVDSVPTPDVLAMIQENAFEKAASITDEQISDMINYGVFENIGCDEYIDELVGADEELEYYDEEDAY